MSAKPLSDEELAWLRGLRAIPLEGDEYAYRLRLLATIDVLKREAERYEERERHFANALKVADGGQYRADWDGAIARVISERDALKASNAALKLEQTEARRIIQETGDELERLRSEVARLRGERDELRAVLTPIGEGRREQCNWRLYAHTGGHTNCVKMRGHIGPHENHGKVRGGDGWEAGPPVELPGGEDIARTALAHPTPPVSGGDRKETSE